MPSVGTAYVNVRINTKSFTTSLDGVMKRLSKQMEAAGTQLGKDFERGVKKTDFNAAFKPLTDAAGKAATAVDNSSQRMGDSMRRAGDTIRDSSLNGADGLDALGDAAKDARGDIGALGKTASNARRALAGLGSGGSGGAAGLRAGGDSAGFFSRQLDDIARSAPRAQKTLASIYNMAAFGGTALAGLVGGLSGAAQGIFVVGANAAAAAPALSIFTNGLLSMMQVGGTLAISMKGVGEAIGAGFESVAPGLDQAKAASDGVADAVRAAQDAVEAARRGVADALRGVADARRGVEDARRGLQDAFEDAARAADDAARAAEEAARRTIRAEQDLAASQRETLIAQRALNSARKEGLEQLEDIAFTAEDAALAEERASLSLEDAYNSLQAVSELPPDNRARQEAELAFKEAELNMRQARDAREDADRAQREAARSGVEGTDAMRDAREGLASAQQAEADSARDLADARREEAQVAIDNARSIEDANEAIADAQRGLADAHRGVADAQRNLAEANDNLADSLARLRDAHKPSTAATSEAATALDNYNDALSKLSKPQQEFVKRIVGMRDKFQAMRNAIAAPLFEGLLTGLDLLNKKGKDNADIYDVIQKGLRGTSDALGDTAVLFADTANNDVFQKSFGDAMQSNNKAMRNFGRAGVNLAAAFVSVADAAGPLFVKFSDWVREVTRGWRQTSRLKNNTGELTKTFNTAGERVSEFWGLAKQLWRTLRILGSAANDAANGFDYMGRNGKKQEGYIPSLTDSLKGFNNSLEKNPTLVGRFTRALKNLNAVGRFLKTIFKPIVELGQDKDVEKAFNILSKTDAFDRLGKAAGDALPEFARLARRVAEILATLAESGSIEKFLEVLSDAAKVVKDIVDGFASVEVGGKSLIGILGTIYGTVRGIKLLWGLTKFLVAGTLGDLRKFKPSNIKNGFDRVATSVGNVMSSIGRATRNSITFFRNIGRRMKGQTLRPYDVKPPVADARDQEGAEQAGRKITQNYAEGLREGLTAVEAAMEALEALIRQNLVEMGAKLRGNAVTAGRNLMIGLASGIRTSTGVATAAATTAGATIIAAMKRAMGEKSPSVLTQQQGRDLMVGLSMGINQGKPAATATATAAGAQVGAAVGAGTNTALASAGAKSTGRFAAMFSTFGKAMLPVGRLLGSAFSLMLGPVGLIVFTVLPLLMPLLQKLNDKFKITEKVMNGVKWALGKLGDGFKFVWDWIKDNWPKLLIILTGPIGIAVALIVKNWDKIWKGLRKAWDKITSIWTNFIDWLKERRKALGESLRALWDNLFERLRNAIRVIGVVWKAFTTWRDRKKKEFRDKLREIWDNLWERLRAAWDKIIGIWNSFVEWRDRKKAEFARALVDFFAPMVEALRNAWDAITTKWETIKGAVAKWPDQIGRSLKNLFNGMGEGLINGINWVGDKVNWMIDKINDLTGKFGGPQINVSWPELRWVGFAKGGPVRGPGGPKGDKIPARLSDGEHVWTAREVRALGGHRNVEKMRKAALNGDLPQGGLFGAIASGFKSVGSAIKNGAETAIKWVLGNFVDMMPDNFIGDFIGSMISNAAEKFTGWGETQDRQEDRKARRQGKIPPYNGPKTGWVYPLSTYYAGKNWEGHSPSTAYDISAPSGTGVRAASGGVVSVVKNLGGSSYGLYVVVSHADGWQSLYAHLGSVATSLGKIVRPGQLIGRSGNSGGSTGPHLHIELSKNVGSSGALSTYAEFLRRGVRLAKGGVVSPSPQGTLAVLAEAGKSERVTPLDPEGFTPAERRIIETLEAKMGGGGGGDTFHVHPSERMDETRLADLVARRVAWKRRRGAGTR